MSRYKLETNDGITVIVGWDNPMRTFFYQSFKNYGKNDEEEIEWFGDGFDAITNIIQLENIVNNAGYSLDDGTKMLLTHDGIYATPPTPLQMQVNKMFQELHNKKEL